MNRYVLGVVYLSLWTGLLKAQDVQTIVYPVRSAAANSLVEPLTHFYPQAYITAQPEGNVVLIRVEADSRDEIIRVLEQLDRPKRSVVVHVYLLKSHGAPLSPDETSELSGTSDEVMKRIAAMRKADQLSIANRIEMTTLEDNPAIVQTGGDQRVLTGTTVSGSRGRTNSYTQLQTGTMFKVQARVTPDNEIVMAVDFEKSELIPVANANDDDPSGRPSVSRLTHQSTVQLANGDALLAGTMVGKPDATSGHSYLVVTARLRGTAAKRTAARQSNRSQETRDRMQQFQSLRGGGGASGGFFGGGGGAGGSFGGRPSAEVVERIARGSFERADRDSNGVLSGDELDTPGTGADKADADENGEVTFDELRKHIAARLRPESTAKPGEPAKTTSSNQRPSRLDERYLMYYSAVVKKYDSNRDGKLSADEWKAMSKDPSAADKNEDGFVTPQELSDWNRRK